MTAAVEQDWLTWRGLGLGASEIASVARVEGAFESPYAVWAKKVGLLPPSDPDESMAELFEWGHDVEPIVARRFERKHPGLHVLGEQTWCEHPERSWMRATPDGFVAESPSTALANALGGFEVKFDRTWSPWDEVPPHYQAQAQWQMAVTGMERTWFGVVHGWRVRFYEFERNQADIDWLTEVGERFWFDHVVAGKAPATDGHPATTDALAHAFTPDDELDGVELVGELVTALEDLRAVKERIASFERIEATRTNQIKAALGDATTALVDGKKVATWRASDRQSVDLKGLRAEAPEIVAAHTTTTSVRRFLLAPVSKEKTDARSR